MFMHRRITPYYVLMQFATSTSLNISETINSTWICEAIALTVLIAEVLPR